MFVHPGKDSGTYIWTPVGLTCGLTQLIDTDFRLEMGRMVTSHEWIHLHTTVSMLSILCNTCTVSILPMVYSLHSLAKAV